MKSVRKLSSFLVLTLFAITSWAVPPTDDSIVELIVLSGLKEQTNMLAGGIALGVQQQAQASGKEAPQDLINSIHANVNAQKMMDGQKLALRSALSQAEVDDLITWYQSDLGHRIARAEERASSPEAYQELVSVAPKLLANQELLSNVDQIVVAANMVDVQMKMQNSVLAASLVAVSNLINPDEPANADEIMAAIKAQEPQLRSAMEQTVLVSMAYAYKDFGARDLEAYAQALRSPTMKKFTRVGVDTLTDQLSEAMGDVFINLGN